MVSCGRQFGKTTMAIIAAVNRLVRGQRIWFGSPTYSNSKRVFRELQSVLVDVPSVNVNKSDLRIELGRGFIQCVSLTEADNLRGENLNWLVVDEAAFVDDGVWDSVLEPMLLTKDDAGALFISSPMGHNWFHTLYQRGLDPEQPDWISFRHSSYENPLIDVSRLDDIKTRVPERVFKQEYLGEFIEDTGAVFSGVKAISTVEPRYHREPNHRYVVGVDLGKHYDFTVFSVINVSTCEQVWIERFNQMSFVLQQARFRRLVEYWQPELVVIETNYNEAFTDWALGNDYPVFGFFTNATATRWNPSKGAIIEQLGVAIERHGISLLNDPVQIAELQAFGMERKAGGRMSYSAPAGKHDDTVMALALAYYGYTRVVSGGAVVQSNAYGDMQ